MGRVNPGSLKKGLFSMSGKLKPQIKKMARARN